ncbi:MAG: hypothetical protein JO052_12665 [Bradyrhizobium sp.]|nr:hypothetical protein [Bradyrhizobium sp.]
MALLISGILLTALAWIVAWGTSGFLSEHTFFPLWLGYILAVNGLSEVRFKSSLLETMGGSFLLLFLISIPLWWFFEGMNAIVQNWHYRLAQPVSSTQYVLEASLDFSTVVPAVLSTGFLLLAAARDFRVPWPRWRPRVSERGLAAAVLIGIGCFALLPLFPDESFPLVWIAPILILEPIASAIGFPSLLTDVQTNGWRRVFAVMTATLVTGFWWEMWNVYSLPKWTYTIPYVGFWHVFEMPLLGYLGYPFFGIAVFSYAAIMLMLLTKQNLLVLLPQAENDLPANRAGPSGVRATNGGEPAAVRKCSRQYGD